MKVERGSTLFLKVVILLIAVGALAGLIWFPQTEGRATNLDLVSIYKDPFIIYIYIASISFFVALFQAIQLLGYVEKNQIFSQAAVKAIRNIKYCAIALAAFIAAAILYISAMAKATNDDPAGGVVIGFVIIFASAVIATAAAVFQKLLQNAIAIKSENDLTV
ncbi:MAG: DUF2975 domain-containing protein [Caldilineaceae bacterium]|nr:DUF2975 domain-containing protein [Caldilineaceae bacterium]